jgi:hypothetical protein
VSFDLEAERVTSTLALPAPAGRKYRWQLTEVHGVLQRLAAPQFAYGEHVLTTEAQYRDANWEGVFVHRMAPGRLRCDEVRSVRIGKQAPGVRVSGISTGDGNSIGILGVFAYVETKEPLGANIIEKVLN